MLPRTDTAPPEADAGGVVATVPVTEIDVNPSQPRNLFEEEPLDSLAESIRRHGVLQPLVVRRVGERYELIAGERRLRAAAAAGLAAVPVVFRDADDLDRMEIALVENLQREDLTPLEEAAAFRRLMDEFGLTQEEVASRVGKSRPAVANALRLLGLPDPVKEQLASGALTAGHARAVLGVEGADAQIEFAAELIAGQVPKAAAEHLARAKRSRPARGGRKPPRGRGDPNLRAVAEQLTGALGTRVRIVPKKRGGAIEIEYYSPEELNRLIDRLLQTR